MKSFMFSFFIYYIYIPDGLLMSFCRSWFTDKWLTFAIAPLDLVFFNELNLGPWPEAGFKEP